MTATSAGVWHQSGGEVYRLFSSTVAQTCATGVYTAVSWATSDSAVGDIGFTTSYIFTCNTSGLYLINANVTWATVGAVVANAVVGIGLGAGGGNGSDSLYRRYENANSLAQFIQNASWERPMSAGETVSVFAYHNQGINRALSNRRLTIRRVGNKY